MTDNDLYDQGRALMDARAFDQAVLVFSRSAAVSPHFKTLELLGECFMELGRFHEAVVPLAAAVTLNRQSRAPALLAEVFERLGDREGAVEMAKLAIERSAVNKRAQAVIDRLGLQ
jgi:Flp pilus assembly protein TadD